MSFSNKRQICKLFPNYLHSKDTKGQRYISSRKIIQLEISPARDIYLQLEIYISSQRYISPASDIYLFSKYLNSKESQRYIQLQNLSIYRYLQQEIYKSPATDIYLQLQINIHLQLEIDIQIVSKKFDFVEHNFVLYFYWLKLHNCRFSFGSYVFFQQEIDI